MRIISNSDRFNATVRSDRHIHFSSNLKFKLISKNIEAMDKCDDNNINVSITKNELATLPVAAYHGNIHVVDSEEDAIKAVEVLAAESVIGFDTETKPSFKRGQSNDVALLQLSTHTDCYLFRLNHIGLPEVVRNLLETEDVLKIGLSIHDDFHNLRKIYELEPKGFIDLQNYVKYYDIADNSLSRIYGILFGRRISKGQRLTNWEAADLTPNQQNYAALDALACIQIYEYLSKGRFNPEESPYLRDNENQ